jgi:hypothetical protein
MTTSNSGVSACSACPAGSQAKAITAAKIEQRKLRFTDASRIARRGHDPCTPFASAPTSP